MKTRTILLLSAGLLLLAGLVAPIAAARDGVWRTEWASPLTAPQLGAEVQLSPGATPDFDRYKPAVAHNNLHKEYLVVWHNTYSSGHRDIYARRISETGELRSWFAVSAGSNDRLQPAVAYNWTNDEYLVVWMYNANGDGSTYEIWGRIVAWNGSYMGSEFRIIQWTNRSFWTPRVAWNSYRNEYMVIWNAFDTSGGFPGNPNDVAGSRISNGGSILGTYIFTSGTSPHQADITYNIAADEYLVVWEHAYPGPCCDWDIRGQELDVSGNLVGSELIISQTSDDELYPDVVARPGPFRDYLAIWQRTTSAGEAIYASRWGEPGVTPYYFEVASAAFWNNKAPAVATDSPGYLIVYEGDSTGDPTVYQHIYGRMWWPEAVYLPLILRNKS